ncbi:MAG: pyridoxal phosphate-dependent aminotransferase family protein [Bacteroidia bacterium]|nr:pyridoxal phosphate-dependent aminotransferase family protein [Bacteroidia bacterium]MDW8134683.1 pyridoxal phosphate-dependent aminotransferase family protein [Bacteroidia bacterium]
MEQWGLRESAMPLEARIKALLERSPHRPFWSHKEEEADFSTNDYLGLNQEGVIKSILQECPPEWLRGSGGSRYLGGDAEVFSLVEAEAEKLWGTSGKKALFFPSGLNANLAFWSTIPQRGDTILFDREVHASIRQGIRLSSAIAWGFPHNNFEEAERLIRKARGEVFIAVESLYSMRGDTPEPKALRYLQERYNCHIVIDEAHTTFIFPAGQSWSEREGLTPLAVLYTFGKAVGLVGGVWIAPPWLIEYLRRKGFAGIYTTALPYCIPWAIAQILYRNTYWQERRERLWGHIYYTSQLLQAYHIPYEGLKGPIAFLPANHPLPLKKLYPPTVAYPGYRLTLHAHNTETEIQELFSYIRQ